MPPPSSPPLPATAATPPPPHPPRDDSPPPSPTPPRRGSLQVDYSPDTTPQPSRLRRLTTKTTTFLRGPTPPHTAPFVPLYPRLQSWPSTTLKNTFKRRRHRSAFLASYLFLWLVLFIVVTHYSRFAARVSGVTPTNLACTSSLWAKNNGCGLDGTGCLPFDGSSFGFRCPAGCESAGKVLNPRAVGDRMVSYAPFVVGGGDGDGVYRADSFLCPAFLHSGLGTNRQGGCGILTRTGSSSSFPASSAHGISSTPFPASFPSSFILSPGDSSHCADLRWPTLAISLPFTVVTTLISPYPALTFASVFTGVFFHVALASDPPFLPDPAAVVSRALSRFLPAAFVAYVLFHHLLAPLYSRRTDAAERAVLHLTGLWVGALTNETFDTWVPITRLTARDLAQQPGAQAALIILCLLLAAIVLTQAHAIRLAGLLPRYLKFYIAAGLSLALLAAIPRESLRIHHYILALLLLPGAAAVYTRPSLLWTGILLGLFVNGTARWGFAGIVETSDSLVGDGLWFSPLPAFEPPPTVRADNVTIHWPWSSSDGGEGWGAGGGVSVLVNDVERVRWRAGNASAAGNVTVRRTEGEKLFVRLGYFDDVGGSYDYTRAGVVEGNGRWRGPVAGWS
ncbi:hypothetical protein EDC01DRAFT_714114 [Geopyxis carbonaria]|nr:hypothetical protein EDC01DRAFT_714114 [Geopyxis carbonaria]